MYTYTYLRRIGSYSTYVDTYIAHTIGSEAGGDAGFGTPTVQQLWGEARNICPCHVSKYVRCSRE